MIIYFINLWTEMGVSCYHEEYASRVEVYDLVWSLFSKNNSKRICFKQFLKIALYL